MQGEGRVTCPPAGWEPGQDLVQAGAEPVVYLTRLVAAGATASEQLKNVLFGRRLPGAGCPVCCDKQGKISRKHLPASQANLC